MALGLQGRAQDIPLLDSELSMEELKGVNNLLGVGPLLHPRPIAKVEPVSSWAEEVEAARPTATVSTGV